MGDRYGKVQEKLLCRDETLTLDAAMDIARTHEATLANMQQFAGDAYSISHVSRSRKTRDPSGRRQVPIRVESADVVMRPQNVVQQRAALVTLVVS